MGGANQRFAPMELDLRERRFYKHCVPTGQVERLLPLARH